MLPQPHLYGIFISTGLGFVYLYAKINCSKFKINFASVEGAFFLAFVFGLISARLYHLLSSWSYYQTNLLQIFLVWQGGLGIFGAIIGGLFGLTIYAKLRKINLLNLLNLLAPPVLICQAIGRLGNFFNQEGYGPATTLPWGIYIPAQHNYVHPTFFYESLLCLLAFLLYLLINKLTNKLHSGFAYYLIAYGFIRLLTESFRLDTWQIFGFKLGYAFALGMIFSGAILFSSRFKAG